MATIRKPPSKPKYYFALAGIVIGPYSQRQVLKLLAKGKISPVTSASIRGRSEWLPLEALLNESCQKEGPLVVWDRAWFRCLAVIAASLILASSSLRPPVVATAIPVVIALAMTSSWVGFRGIIGGVGAILFIFASLATPGNLKREPSEEEVMRQKAIGFQWRALSIHQEAMYLAAKEGRSEIVAALFAKGQKVDARDESSLRTPLHAAAEANDLKSVDFLLNHGASAGVSDRWGCQPLHLAVKAGNVEMVRRLLAAGAPLRGADESGYLPIHHAAETGNVEILRLLHSAGCPLDAKQEKAVYFTGYREKNHPAVLDMYVQLRLPMDPLLQPLHVAARAGKVNVVRFLLASNVNPEAHDLGGPTPAQCIRAGDRNKPEFIQILRLLEEATARK